MYLLQNMLLTTILLATLSAAVPAPVPATPTNSLARREDTPTSTTPDDAAPTEGGATDKASTEEAPAAAADGTTTTTTTPATDGAASLPPDTCAYTDYSAVYQWTISLPVPDTTETDPCAQAEEALPLKCAAHPWNCRVETTSAPGADAGGAAGGGAGGGGGGGSGGGGGRAVRIDTYTASLCKAGDMLPALVSVVRPGTAAAGAGCERRPGPLDKVQGIMFQYQPLLERAKMAWQRRRYQRAQRARAKGAAAAAGGSRGVTARVGSALRGASRTEGTKVKKSGH